MNPKQLVGEKATEYIKENMIVGLGTGSTAYFAIMKIGEMVKNGFRITGVPTSKATEDLALSLNIPLLNIADVKKIDVTIDGADEYDTHKNLIKGGGGALLREKIIASITEFYVIIADKDKGCDILGDFAVPVEVTPFAKEITINQLKALGCEPKFRQKDAELFITDNQNYIADCKFKEIKNPKELTAMINSIPGVVENGLFVGMADVIISDDGEGGIIEID
ncbi:ribose 5-phosphate isomerase A [Pedobacter psychrophilus]|uniref:Ribose-5-phosphate isomerase A n=1 Tax=Pedobacter psychrophilus TaxID=1826909 RepID=A0A179DFJ4_9SPHI|nr:ribose-5-phosphate isomerase RpiA [Pedobacter psychrophilus]OAQ39674.1 ribose 5-phosphate isomerase A [Pedobacter psychrophilus]